MSDIPPGGIGRNRISAAFLSAAEAFLAEHTSNPERLSYAYEYLQHSQATGGWPATAIWEAVNLLRRHQILTDADEDCFRDRFTTEAKDAIQSHLTRLPGFRIFNHAINTANFCDVVARLWPDSPDAETLMAASEEVWNEWWVLGENIEGAPNYEGFNNSQLLIWAQRRGQLQIALDHPGTRHWMARSNNHVFPNGFIPCYGDGNNCEIWTQWMSMLALQAVWSGDSHALWAAEKVFGWHEERRSLGSNLDLVEQNAGKPLKASMGWCYMAMAAHNLAIAFRALREIPAGIEPEGPAYRPVVTHRILPTHDLIRDASWSLHPPEPGIRVPDQTVLRFGPDDTCHAVMLSCGRQIWHDHMDSGSIVSYVADGVVLLEDNGYESKLPIDHNLFLATQSGEEWLGYSPDDWPRRRAKVGSFGGFDFQVRGLSGRDVAQVVVAECNVPFDMPIRQERTVLLARRGQLVVYDRILPFATGLTGSPLWHVQTVHEHGPGWVEGSFDVFTGRGGSVTRNAPGTVLVVDAFNRDPWTVTEQHKCDHHAPDGAPPATRENYELIDAAHVSRMCISRPVPLRANSIERFVSVLMPRNRVSSPDNAVRVVSRDSDGVFLLNVAGDTLVVNESEEIVSGCWGSTDAETLWLDTSGVFAHRVRNVALADISLCTDEMWIDLDLTWNGGRVHGHIASEKPAVITLTRNGTHRKVHVFGITPVDEVF